MEFKSEYHLLNDKWQNFTKDRPNNSRAQYLSSVYINYQYYERITFLWAKNTSDDFPQLLKTLFVCELKSDHQPHIKTHSP